jgi:hypothetical protein
MRTLNADYDDARQWIDRRIVMLKRHIKNGTTRSEADANKELNILYLISSELSPSNISRTAFDEAQKLYGLIRTCNVIDGVVEFKVPKKSAIELLVRAIGEDE